MKKVLFIITMLIMVGCTQKTYEKDVTDKIYSIVKFKLARELVNEFHKDLGANKIQGITMPYVYYDKQKNEVDIKMFDADSKQSNELHELFNKRIIATYRENDDVLINIEYR